MAAVLTPASVGHGPFVPQGALQVLSPLLIVGQHASGAVCGETVSAFPQLAPPCSSPRDSFRLF